jgi:hypothetical protein
LGKQIKLNISADLPLTIIGIVSVESDLKLSWSINQLLDIQLTQAKMIAIQQSKTGKTLEFPLFQFDDETHLLKYNLLANRYKSNYFFEELKNIDYLLIIRGDLDFENKAEILLKLKTSTEITSLLIIDSNSLRKKEKLELF